MIQFSLIGTLFLLNATLLPGQDAAVSDAQPMMLNNNVYVPTFWKGRVLLPFEVALLG